MTIGINLLREAREKFAAAVAAVKDELKNPDTAEEVKPAAIELGNAFDEHLNDLNCSIGPPVEKHETLIERVEEGAQEALDAAGNAIGEAKFNN